MKNIVNSELPQKLAAWIGTLSPSCKEVARLQSASVARPLSLAERLGLRIHLSICSWCRRFGEQVNFLRSAAHRCCDIEPTNTLTSLTAERRERIKKAMRAIQK